MIKYLLYIIYWKLISKCERKFPVKNMAWIIMEIPYHFMSQIDGSFIEIHTKFRDHSMSFIQALLVFHAGT